MLQVRAPARTAWNIRKEVRIPAQLFPRISFAVLGDSHRVADSGKVDILGIFDTLTVWGFPAHRQFSVGIGVRDIGVGVHRVTYWVRRNRAKSEMVAEGQLDADQKLHSTIFAHRITVSLKGEGLHELGVVVGSGATARGAMWLPLNVVKTPWPSPPAGADLKAVLSDPHAIKAARATIDCGKCKRRYVFEVQLDPDAVRPSGSRAFPASGQFKCPECGTIHHLRDIEGQLLAQLGRVSSGGGK